MNVAIDNDRINTNRYIVRCDCRDILAEKYIKENCTARKSEEFHSNKINYIHKMTFIKLTLFLPYKIYTYFHKIRNRSGSAFVSKKETYLDQVKIQRKTFSEHIWLLNLSIRNHSLVSIMNSLGRRLILLRSPNFYDPIFYGRIPPN